MTGSDETLVDLIYEAATDPDLWAEVIGLLAQEVDAAAGLIVMRRADAWIGWVGSGPFATEQTDSWLANRATSSQVTANLLSFQREGFVAEHEGFEDSEWLADPFMSEWCGPLGLHHCTATAITVPNRDLVVVQINRNAGKPRFDQQDIARLDVYRPHLARAGMLAARWRLERLRSATEAFATIGLPAAVLDASGKVLVANSLMEVAKAHFVWLPKDRIALIDPSANAMLRRAIAETMAPSAAIVRSIPSRGRGNNPAIVHLIPTKGKARDLFGGGLAFLILTSISAPEAPDATLLQGLFDLTPAEARVARAIVRQKTIKTIAKELGISHETVRTQVKSVLAKTGCARQADLVAMLAYANVPR
jgi:DNA-binding CsgD family transcriptional regulator